MGSDIYNYNYTNANRQQLINVFGSKGIGKTATVYQAVKYLQFRHYFTQGIFMIDLKDKIDIIQEVNMILNNLNSSNYKKRLTSI